MFVFRAPKIDPERLVKATQPSGASSARPTRPFVDKRDRPRLATWQRCIVQDRHSFRLDGVLMNYTEKGAHVRFRTHQTPPRDVILIVPSLGITRPARIVWSDRGDAGLVFL